MAANNSRNLYFKFVMFTILNEIMHLDLIHFQTVEIGRTFFVTLRSDVVKTLDERIHKKKFPCLLSKQLIIESRVKLSRLNVLDARSNELLAVCM